MAEPQVSRQQAARELLWRRCNPHLGGSFLFFFSNVWVVQVPRKGPVHPAARRFQARLIGLLEAHPLLLLVALKARQIGFTTVVAAYAVWWCLFHNDSPWLMASRNEQAAQKNLARAAYGWRRLPAWFKERCPECTSDTTERLAWANESRIESIPASAASGRSDSVYGVLFDEAAHMDNPGELFASLQPLCYGPFLVFSSANGMGNWFAQTFDDALLPDSEWVLFEAWWDEVEERDQDWYRRTLRKFRGQEWAFYQEHPSNRTEAFARSGRVAFGGDLIDDLEYRIPDWRFRWSGTGFDVEHPLEPTVEDDLELWVWARPTVLRDENGRTVQAPNYVVFCDPAEGLAHGDETAITVWDANLGEQVASSLSHFPIEDLDVVLAWIGYWYHTALILVERNNQGILPIVGLARLGYPRLYRMAQFGQIVEGDRTPRYGWMTSRQSKPKMVHDFLHALRAEPRAVQLHDHRWRVQASTYVADGKGGYSAADQNRDDLMTAMLGGWQGVLDVGKYPTVWVDDREQPPTWGDILNMEDPPQRGGSESLQVGGRQRGAPQAHRSFTLWRP